MITRPLDPNAVAAADAAILAKTGGRKLTMAPEDAALRKEWADQYKKSLPPADNPAPPPQQRDMGASQEICPLPPTPEKSEFDKKFEAATGGMTVDESIDLYKKQTGKDLTREQVEAMFTDSDSAKALLEADKDLHTTYRDILNTNIPASKEDAEAQGFKKLPWHQSIFHQDYYNPFGSNEKYVSADGHREVVFDSNGEVVSDRSNLGTFNFFGPDKAGDHKAADVDPYMKWGN
ncbi:hypothetical protein OVA24_10650 [Luteolibacter sp. SL250]|uniref:hypothetical protein n=1 Tax=Luteolibacter sp. SL250 TaxID=2995170 RepID=UPI00226F2C6C|nr:hypothetical protein [Luteolibacter sp. SL250]WAC21842.1 hypothetical protein OVA24_10650 [Luteolibacter sp. SL250]